MLEKAEMEISTRELLRRRVREERTSRLIKFGGSLLGCGCLTVLFLGIAAVGAGGSYVAGELRFSPLPQIAGAVMMFGILILLIGIIPRAMAKAAYNKYRVSIASHEEKAEAVIDTLIGYAKNSDYGYDGVVINVLGDMIDKRATEHIIPALKHQDAGIRKKAVKAIAKIKDERAIQPLTEALADDDKGVQKEAASALALLGWNTKKNP